MTYIQHKTGFQGGASGKEPTYQRRRRKRYGFDLSVGKIPWKRAWQPSPVFLPREFLEQRSLVGYSPQGHKGLDMTEATSHTHTHTHTHTQHKMIINKFCEHPSSHTNRK